MISQEAESHTEANNKKSQHKIAIFLLLSLMSILTSIALILTFYWTELTA